MKTAIITAAKGYTIHDVKPWTESLKTSGFIGKKFVVLYEPSDEIAEYFKENDFNVLIGTDDNMSHIATQRFRDYANLLSSEHGKDIDLVIHTDIRDVIFQNDPEKWLTKNIGNYHIIASGEGVTYRHEDWNGDGIQTHYGKEIFDEIIDEETLCSGIIAGRREAFIKLCQTVYELAFFSNDPSGFADQHFYNLAIRKSFSDITKIASADSSWTLNCGTMVAIPFTSPDWSTGPRTAHSSYERFRKGSYVENMLTGLPAINNNKAITPTGEEYFIVHQYDRYLPWKEQLLENIIKINYVTDTKDLGFYMWAYSNLENVDYIFSKLRTAYPESHIVISSDAGEDFSEIAEKYKATKYIHGLTRHGYPQKPERYGWTADEAKLYMDRFYEACAAMDCEYIMMMDEDVLVKEAFKFQENDIIMTPGIYNNIGSAGMQWISSRGGRTDYPYYSFGGGSILRRTKFMQAYENHKEDFFNNYEEIYQKSMAEHAIGWGWNDSMICSFMYADRAEFSTNLPVIESGNEDDPAPIIHKFKKFYNQTQNA